MYACVNLTAVLFRDRVKEREKEQEGGGGGGGLEKHREEGKKEMEIGWCVSVFALLYMKTKKGVNLLQCVFEQYLINGWKPYWK